MAIDIRMPKLSDNMEEGVIIRWMKSPGDRVSKGEPLAEVETDKADVELEAADSGVLREIKVAQGQSAVVGAVIAVLSAPGEGDEREPVGRAGGAGAPTGGTEDGGARRREPAAGGPGTPSPADRSTVRRPPSPESVRRAGGEPDATGDHPVRASPLAWRLADEAGVNLAGVRGSGPGGRILKRDVEASVRGPVAATRERGAAGPAAAARAEGRPARTGEGPPPADASTPLAPVEGRLHVASTGSGSRLIETTRMRRAVATRMAEAKREIPHFYLTAEVDMSEAMHLRESIKRREAMPGLTVTHLLLRGLAMALVRHPRLNASWRDGAIELHDDVNIGIAVAVADGLVVPVLHRAQTLTLGEIATRAAALTDKARAGKFSGEELMGGTFSLSNVGMLDVEELVAVINPPQAAILAVAAVKDRPIVRDGRLAVAKTMRATLSCDHRVLNGVEGGRFLEELKGILENPVTLLLE